MKKVSFLVLFGILFFISSCQRLEDPVANVLEHNMAPFIPLKQEFEPVSSVRSTTATTYDNLGYGYDSYSYPFESTTNTTYEVIQVNRLSEDPILQSAVRVKNVNEALANYRAFSSYKEYEDLHKLKYSVDVKVGVSDSIKKKGFQAGFRFMSKDIDQESELTRFAETEMGIRTKSYSLNVIDSTHLYSYLNPKFKLDYYKNSPDRLVGMYGWHVLTGYDAGAKAFGVYVAKAKENYSEFERDMGAYAKVSFSNIVTKVFGLDINVSAEWSDSIKNIKKNKFQDFRLSYRTFGGNPSLGLPAFVGPNNPDNVTMDLREWAKSVMNPEYYQIFSIHKAGLTPISNFIIEDNLRRAFENYVEYGRKVQFRMPVFLLDPSGYGYDVYIVTRMGDLIRISDGKLRRIKNANGGPIMGFTTPPSTDGFPIYLPEYRGGNAWFQRVFVCENEDQTIEFSDSLFNHIKYPSYIKYDLSNLDVSSLKIYRIKNEPSKTKYLYLECPSGRYLLSIINSEVEKEWYALKLSGIPEVEVSSEILSYVKVIAL